MEQPSESITEVDETTQDAWVAEAAVQTNGRIEAFEPEDAPFVTQAQDEYSESLSEIRDADVAVTHGDSGESHE